MKKLLVVAFILSLISACGGGGSDGTSEGAGTPSTSESSVLLSRNYNKTWTLYWASSACPELPQMIKTFYTESYIDHDGIIVFGDKSKFEIEDMSSNIIVSASLHPDGSVDFTWLDLTCNGDKRFLKHYTNGYEKGNYLYASCLTTDNQLCRIDYLMN